jgi:hypothetical protein
MVTLTHRQVSRDCFLGGWQVQEVLAPGRATSSGNMMAPLCGLLWNVHNAHWAIQLPQICKKNIVIYQISITSHVCLFW